MAPEHAKAPGVARTLPSIRPPGRFLSNAARPLADTAGRTALRSPETATSAGRTFRFAAGPFRFRSHRRSRSTAANSAALENTPTSAGPCPAVRNPEVSAPPVELPARSEHGGISCPTPPGPSPTPPAGPPSAPRKRQRPPAARSASRPARSDSVHTDVPGPPPPTPPRSRTRRHRQAPALPFATIEAEVSAPPVELPARSEHGGISCPTPPGPSPTPPAGPPSAPRKRQRPPVARPASRPARSDSVHTDVPGPPPPTPPRSRTRRHRQAPALPFATIEAEVSAPPVELPARSEHGGISCPTPPGPSPTPPAGPPSAPRKRQRPPVARPASRPDRSDSVHTDVPGPPPPTPPRSRTRRHRQAPALPVAIVETAGSAPPPRPPRRRRRRVRKPELQPENLQAARDRVANAKENLTNTRERPPSTPTPPRRSRSRFRR